MSLISPLILFFILLLTRCPFIVILKSDKIFCLYAAPLKQHFLADKIGQEIPFMKLNIINHTTRLPMRRFNYLSILLILLSINSVQTSAHCDGVDGPVVLAAKKAIETNNLDHALIWIQPEHEDELRAVFEKTLKVRNQSKEAQELADMYFFETFVRLHRLGEGAAYTGLKPAGTDLGAAIPLADKSIDNESLTELYKLLSNEIHDGLHNYFEELMSKKNFDTNNVNAGREFVESYVKFMHYVENIYESSKISDHSPNNHIKSSNSHSH